jgi:hypothetical protein
LIYCKNFCKCHNVPPPSTTIIIIIKNLKKEKKKEMKNVFNGLNSKLDTVKEKSQ